VDVERCWVSHPPEWQPWFLRWSQECPSGAELHRWSQRGGEAIVGLTLRADAAEPSVRLLVAVPHGHEPAPTAAAVNAVSQLLTGAYLDGTPSPLRRDRILSQVLVTFLPDTNSQGRARSPQRCWDGTTCDNETFWRHAFGVAGNGERFGRYAEWRLSGHAPRQVGIVYERLDEDLYVEPNTSVRSTHSRAVEELFARYRYTHMLEMHQHEWPEAALLPADFDDLSPAEQGLLQAWSRVVVDAWRRAGAAPRPEPSIPYKGQPRQQLFRDFWRGRCPGMLRMAVEVRNNRLVSSDEPTPMAYQFPVACAALEATLEALAEGPLGG
jgi:hypothetical protein